MQEKKRVECVIEFTGSLGFGVLMWRMRKGLVVKATIIEVRW